MDAYTKDLLARAVESSSTLGIETLPGGVYLYGSDASQEGSSGPTLDAALIALLRDLGEDVPERPSLERLEERADAFFDVSSEAPDQALAWLSDLDRSEHEAGRGPLLVDALLGRDGAS